MKAILSLVKPATRAAGLPGRWRAGKNVSRTANVEIPRCICNRQYFRNRRKGQIALERGWVPRSWGRISFSYPPP